MPPYSYFAYISFVAAIFNLVVAVFIFWINPRGKINQLLSLSAVALFIWGFGEAMYRLTDSIDVAYFWMRYVTGTGAALFSAFILHFAIIFTCDLCKYKKTGILVGYFIASLFIVLRMVFPNLVIGSPVLYPWGYAVTSNLLQVVFILYMVVNILFVLWLMVKYYIRSQGKTKTYARYIILSLIFSTIGGIFSQSVAPVVGIDVPELTISLTPFFVFFIAYAVVKHGFMTLNLSMAADRIIDTMADYLIVIDTDHTVVLVNKPMTEILGYTKSELIGSVPEKVFKNASLVNRILEKLAEVGGLDNIETDIKTKSGESIRVSINATKVVDNVRNDVGYVLVLKDVRQSNRLIQGLRSQTRELEKAKERLEKENEMLERFKQVAVNRELAMVDLKKKMKKLEEQLSD